MSQRGKFRSCLSAGKSGRLYRRQVLRVVVILSQRGQKRRHRRNVAAANYFLRIAEPQTQFAKPITRQKLLQSGQPYFGENFPEARFIVQARKPPVNAHAHQLRLMLLVSSL
jgi:hypothetical protein